MKTPEYVRLINAAEFHAAAYASPAALDLALHSAIPQTADQTESEIGLPGYARVSVRSTLTNWTLDGGEAVNAATIDFPTITRGKAEAVCMSFGVAGIIRRLLVFAQPVGLAENRRIEFAPGSITISETA